VLLRLLGINRAGRRARPLQFLPRSLWDRGILPQDSLKLLGEGAAATSKPTHRSHGLGTVALTHQDAWHAQFELRGDCADRNDFQHHRCLRLYRTDLPEPVCPSQPVGEFTEINEYLVRDLKARELWDEVMIADLKYFDGSLAKIDRIPQTCARFTQPRLKSSRLVGGSRIASSEMDRPGAITEHLYGRRVRQKAG